MKVLTEAQIVDAMRSSLKERPLGAMGTCIVDGARVIYELAMRLGHTTAREQMAFAKQCMPKDTWKERA
jgi:hypothetical protein